MGQAMLRGIQSISIICLTIFNQVPLSSQGIISTPGKCGKGIGCCYVSPESPMRPRIDDVTCYTGQGHRYAGKVNETEHGRACINWLQTSMVKISRAAKRRYGIGDHNKCRNPEQAETKGPWCYVSPQNYGYCKILPCIGYPKVDYNEVIMPPSCSSKSPLERPDVMFQYGQSVYYVTPNHPENSHKEYMVYNFTDQSLSAFGNNPEQSLTTDWNLCARKHDILTFATVKNENDPDLYMYFQFPNVMVKFNSKTKSWNEVPNETFSRCTVHVRKFVRTSSGIEGIIRNVFKFNRPSSVFLEAAGYLFECVWFGDKLVISQNFSLNGRFSPCESTSAFFVDSANTSFAISRLSKTSRNSNIGYSPQSKHIYVSEFTEALEQKPGLAVPLLGFGIFDNTSLVKLHASSKNESTTICSSYTPSAQLFRIYSGKDFLNIAIWLNNNYNGDGNVVQVWIQLNTIFTKRADYCKDTSGTFCTRFIKDYRTSRNAAREQNKSVQDEWTVCSLNIDFVKSTMRIICFQDSPLTQNALCQIKLVPEPEQSVSLQSMLGIKDGQNIEYADGDDASEKMSEIADSLQYPSANNDIDINVLIGSVAALQPVNYSGLSTNGTKNLISNFVSVVNNLADSNRTKDWIGMKAKPRLSSDATNNSSQNITSLPTNPHSLLFITENVLQQVVSSGGSKLLDKNSTIRVTTANVVSVIQNLDHANDSVAFNDFFVVNSSTTGTSNQSTVFITSSFPTFVDLISKVERDDKHLQNQTGLNEKNQMFVNNSPIVSATVVRNGKKMPAAVKFKVPFSSKDIPDPHVNGEKYYFSCSHLMENNKWDSSGCHVVAVESDHVTCACNHTTNFAILLQVVPPKILPSDLAILSLISYVGESLSVFCLIITLVVFVAFRHSLKSERMVAHFHLVIALIIFHVIQLFSSNAEQTKDISPVPCIIVATLTHFSLLATFMWMLCEGITLHLNVIDVFNAMSKFKRCRYVIGWGIPLVIALTTVGYGVSQNPFPTCYVEGVGDQSCRSGDLFGSGATDQYLDAQPAVQVIEWCWLTTENYLVWSLVLPAIVVLGINTFLLMRVSCVILRSSRAINRFHVPSSGESKEKNLDHVRLVDHVLRKSLKGAIILMPILGVSWIFGLVPQTFSHVVFLYIFTVMNTTQGIFILLFHCLLNNEVRSVVVRFYRKRNASAPQNWMSQSNFRNPSVDLRQVAPSYDLDAMGVGRSGSTHTNSTYLGGRMSLGGNDLSSFAGSPEEEELNVLLTSFSKGDGDVDFSGGMFGVPGSNDSPFPVADETMAGYNSDDVMGSSQRFKTITQLMHESVCKPESSRHNGFVHRSEHDDF